MINKQKKKYTNLLKTIFYAMWRVLLELENPHKVSSWLYPQFIVTSSNFHIKFTP